jgi:hypothetical protein
MRQKIVLAALAGALGLTGCTPAAAPPQAPVTAQPPMPAAPPPSAPAGTAPPPARTAQPQAFSSSNGMPDGPGKAEVVAACSGCHGLGQLMGEHRDAAGWTTTVTTMINNGAPVADADFDKVVAYLTAHFGP